MVCCSYEDHVHEELDESELLAVLRPRDELTQDHASIPDNRGGRGRTRLQATLTGGGASRERRGGAQGELRRRRARAAAGGQSGSERRESEASGDEEISAGDGDFGVSLGDDEGLDQEQSAGSSDSDPERGAAAALAAGRTRTTRALDRKRMRTARTCMNCVHASRGGDSPRECWGQRACAACCRRAASTGAWRTIGEWIASKGGPPGRKSLDRRHLPDATTDPDGAAAADSKRNNGMVPGWLGVRARAPPLLSGRISTPCARLLVARRQCPAWCPCPPCAPPPRPRAGQVRVASNNTEWTPDYDGDFIPVIYDPTGATKLLVAGAACSTVQEAVRACVRVCAYMCHLQLQPPSRTRGKTRRRPTSTDTLRPMLRWCCARPLGASGSR